MSAFSEPGLAEVTNVLGLSGPIRSSRMEFIGMIERGLPLKSLNRVSEILAPSDTNFKYRIVPRATFARIKQHGHRLSPALGVLVARLADVWSLARSVWGSDEAARDFLFRPHQLLDASRPIDVVMANEIGAQVVRDILGRLQHGSAV